MYSDVTHCDQDQIVTWRIGGDVSLAGIAGAFDRMLRHDGWKSARHLLVVLDRSCRLGDITLADVVKFQDHLADRQSVFGSDTARRVALVPLLKEHEGLTEYHRHSHSRALLETDVFDDEDVALDWLREVA